MVSKPPRISANSVKPTSTARGLGRGLSTLLGDSGIAAAANQVAPADQREYQQIPVEWINVGPWQPRRQLDRGTVWRNWLTDPSKRHRPTDFIAPDTRSARPVSTCRW